MLLEDFNPCRSFGGLPLYRSAAVLFDRRHPCFWNFNSIIPVDVFRVKSYVNSLFKEACSSFYGLRVEFRVEVVQNVKFT